MSTLDKLLKKNSKKNEVDKEEKLLNRVMFGLIFVITLIIVFVFFNPIYFKGQNTQTLIINNYNGNIKLETNSGIGFRNPFVDSVTTTITVSGNQEADFSANSQDNIQINFKTQYIAKIDNLLEFYKKTGKTNDKEATVFIKNYIDEAFDVVVNKYTYDFIKSNIAQIGQEITEATRQKIREGFGLDVERVVISSVNAPESVEKAIQEKIAKQQASEAAKYDLEKAKVDAEALKTRNSVPQEQQQKELCQKAIEKGQSNSPACYFGDGNYYGGNMPAQNN